MCKDDGMIYVSGGICFFLYCELIYFLFRVLSIDRLYTAVDMIRGPLEKFVFPVYDTSDYNLGIKE